MILASLMVLRLRELQGLQQNRDYKLWWLGMVMRGEKGVMGLRYRPRIMQSIY